MTLVKFNPTRDLLSFRDNFDRMVQDLFDKRWDLSESMGELTPAVNIEENENEYSITAELPGVEKSDVKITFEDGALSISGEKRVENEDKKENFHRIERRYGVFSRSFAIPSAIVVEKIDASFKDGVLKVILPKAEEAKPKLIEVKVK
jgi:HSP20 family protein